MDKVVKRRLHKPMTPLELIGVQRCSVCRATRSPHYSEGYYPWRLNGKPMSYCVGKER